MTNTYKETDLVVVDMNPQLEFRISLSCNCVSDVSGRVFVKTSFHFLSDYLSNIMKYFFQLNEIYTLNLQW
jgi:hypothetical protein